MRYPPPPAPTLVSYLFKNPLIASHTNATWSSFSSANMGSETSAKSVAKAAVRVKNRRVTAKLVSSVTSPMRAPAAAPRSPLEAAVRERSLGPSGDPRLDAAAGRLAAAAGESLVGLVFFGSRCTGAARANAWSAYDVFVLVRSYRPFYEAVRRAGLSGKRPGLMALASAWLPPTQFSLRFEPEGVHVKASVLRYETFRRETSPRRRDHVVIGRLFQPARVLQPRDEAARAGIVEGLVAAHRETWSWARPWLP